MLVDAWLATPDHPARPWLLEWRAMLADGPLERIVAVVLDPEGGQTLRQCSPLGPALTARERWTATCDCSKQCASGRDRQSPQPLLV